ncbi:MAG: hypothetical protein ACTSQP_20335 [Promethearchaeota archaeon]
MEYLKILIKIPSMYKTNTNEIEYQNPLLQESFSIYDFKKFLCKKIIKCEKCFSQKNSCSIQKLINFSHSFIVDPIFLMNDNFEKSNNDFFYRYITIYPPLLDLLGFIYICLFVDSKIGNNFFYKNKSPIFKINNHWKNLRQLSKIDIQKFDIYNSSQLFYNILKNKFPNMKLNILIIGKGKYPIDIKNWLYVNIKKRVMSYSNSLLNLFKIISQEIIDYINIKKIEINYYRNKIWKVDISIPPNLKGIFFYQMLLIFRLNKTIDQEMFPILLGNFKI